MPFQLRMRGPIFLDTLPKASGTSRKFTAQHTEHEKGNSSLLAQQPPANRKVCASSAEPPRDPGVGKSRMMPIFSVHSQDAVDNEGRLHQTPSLRFCNSEQFIHIHKACDASLKLSEAISTTQFGEPITRMDRRGEVNSRSNKFKTSTLELNPATIPVRQ